MRHHHESLHSVTLRYAGAAVFLRATALAAPAPLGNLFDDESPAIHINFAYPFKTLASSRR